MCLQGRLSPPEKETKKGFRGFEGKYSVEGCAPAEVDRVLRQEQGSGGVPPRPKLDFAQRRHETHQRIRVEALHPLCNLRRHSNNEQADPSMKQLSGAKTPKCLEAASNERRKADEKKL
jgi:hypothetical protein